MLQMHRKVSSWMWPNRHGSSKTKGMNAIMLIGIKASV
jgi:hypothetical protein